MLRGWKGIYGILLAGILTVQLPAAAVADQRIGIETGGSGGGGAHHKMFATSGIVSATPSDAISPENTKPTGAVPPVKTKLTGADSPENTKPTGAVPPVNATPSDALPPVNTTPDYVDKPVSGVRAANGINLRTGGSNKTFESLEEFSNALFAGRIQAGDVVTVHGKSEEEDTNFSGDFTGITIIWCGLDRHLGNFSKGGNSGTIENLIMRQGRVQVSVPIKKLIMEGGNVNG